nr:MAG TPA: helix-turn-helix domain protein [Caudoviricetes sp.]
MSLGKKLHQIRKEEKLSRLEFAKIIGVTKTTIFNWEHDIHYPDKMSKLMIVEALEELMKDKNKFQALKRKLEVQ